MITVNNMAFAVSDHEPAGRPLWLAIDELEIVWNKGELYLWLFLS